MAQKLVASMPDQLDLDANWQVVFTAVDPTSGAEVSGVTFSNACLEVTQVTPGTAEDLVAGPFQLIPIADLNS
jgi:hypothetical protein